MLLKGGFGTFRLDTFKIEFTLAGSSKLLTIAHSPSLTMAVDSESTHQVVFQQAVLMQNPHAILWAE